MSDKWQEIKLRLDAELANSLRELKRGHDESLSEVVLRLLRKAVRQSPANRGIPDARSGAQGARGGRNAFGAARKGKAPAREPRVGSRGAAHAKPFGAKPFGAKPFGAKPFGAREVAEGDTWAPTERTRRPASASSGPRAARPFPKVGKAFRPQQGEDGGERRRRKVKGRTSRRG